MRIIAFRGSSVRSGAASNSRVARRLPPARAGEAQVFESCARQLYEEAWSKGNIEALQEAMAEDHVQRDVIWSDAASEGRAAMEKGIGTFRRFYPDLNFEIKNLSTDSDNHLCFVEWMAQGTYSGAIEGTEAMEEKEFFGGVSVLTIKEGKIAESRVYRNATTGEKAMFAKRMSE